MLNAQNVKHVGTRLEIGKMLRCPECGSQVWAHLERDNETVIIECDNLACFNEWNHMGIPIDHGE